MGAEFVKRLLYILAPLFFFSATITAIAQDEPKIPIIQSIEVIAGNDKPEQVVFKLNGSHTPKVFRLNGEKPRLVFDFYNTKYPSKIDRISDVGGSVIAGVRVGRHNEPQKTRVVVDIQKNSPYQYDHTFNVSNSSLVVTFSPDFGEESSDKNQVKSQPQRIGVETPKVVHAQTEASTQAESEQTAQVEQDKSAESPAEDIQPVTVITAESRKKVLKTAPEARTDGVGTDPATKSAGQSTDQTAAVETSQSIEPPPPAPQSDQTEEIQPVLLDISFEKSINESETVLFRLNHFYPPLVFGIEKGEPRVVCDFIDAGIDQKIPSVIEVGGQYVNKILVASESDPEKIRVELLLMPNLSYDLQQLFFKEDNLFVVIVKEFQAETAVSN